MGKALAAVAVAALILAGTAGGVGPWPGTVNAIGGYSVTSDGTRTELVAPGGRKAAFTGTWRFPAVTSTQLPGGLSPDGSLLVLTQVSDAAGLRDESRFLVVSTHTLKARPVITLRGEFGFDAVAADNRTLYVIEHRNAQHLNAYIVRAYDLRRRALVTQPVVAKGEGVEMAGYPVARAVTTRGVWVYTLYWRTNGSTFVHALQTTQRRAVCLDLEWRTEQVWSAKLRLSRDGKTLTVRDHGQVVETLATPA